ncbi:DUF2306 domain-containing protein [Methylophilus medardicus]|nr:DUF2306 domain-containing protein [Methylophilus medardicus]
MNKLVANPQRFLAFRHRLGETPYFEKSHTMSYLQLAYLHLATALLAFILGTLQLLQRKGSIQHRLIGKYFMGLMLVTAIIALWMPAQIGPTLMGHFGFIHLFCLLVLYSVPASYLAIRRGHLASHKAHLIGVYVGGLLIAGGFALMPGRLLHGWLF